MSITLIALLLITLLSAALGAWFAFRKPAETPVKVMLFVLYFWLIAFLQLLIAGVAYWAWGQQSTLP